MPNTIPPSSPHALAASLAANIRKRGGVARVMTFKQHGGKKYLLVQEFDEIQGRWRNVKRWDLP